MTTSKQRAAVRYCEKWVEVEFIGDINDFRQVSNYLSKYLDKAKQLEAEEYEENIWTYCDATESDIY